MPTREAIVTTNLGVSTYATDKTPGEILDAIQEKHKYETILRIQIQDRVNLSPST